MHKLTCRYSSVCDIVFVCTCTHHYPTQTRVNHRHRRAFTPILQAQEQSRREEEAREEDEEQTELWSLLECLEQLRYDFGVGELFVFVFVCTNECLHPPPPAYLYKYTNNNNNNHNNPKRSEGGAREAGRGRGRERGGAGGGDRLPAHLHAHARVRGDFLAFWLVGWWLSSRVGLVRLPSTRLHSFIMIASPPSSTAPSARSGWRRWRRGGRRRVGR